MNVEAYLVRRRAEVEATLERYLPLPEGPGATVIRAPARDLARMMITTFQGVALLSKVTRDFSVLRTSLALMEGR